MALKQQQQLNAQRANNIKFGDATAVTPAPMPTMAPVPAPTMPTTPPVATAPVAPFASAANSFVPTAPKPATVSNTAPAPVAPAFAGITDVRLKEKWGSTFGAGQRLNQVV
jgi:hypothetical protein